MHYYIFPALGKVSAMVSNYVHGNYTCEYCIHYSHSFQCLEMKLKSWETYSFINDKLINKRINRMRSVIIWFNLVFNFPLQGSAKAGGKPSCPVTKSRGCFVVVSQQNYR